jgi:hypothetical protein
MKTSHIFAGPGNGRTGNLLVCKVKEKLAKLFLIAFFNRSTCYNAFILWGPVSGFWTRALKKPCKILYNVHTLMYSVDVHILHMHFIFDLY